LKYKKIFVTKRKIERAFNIENAKDLFETM